MRVHLAGELAQLVLSLRLAVLLSHGVEDVVSDLGVPCMMSAKVSAPVLGLAVVGASEPLRGAAVVSAQTY